MAALTATSSITMKSIPSEDSISWMVTMCGWLRAEAAFASWTNRARRLGSESRSAGSTLIARAERGEYLERPDAGSRCEHVISVWSLAGLQPRVAGAAWRPYTPGVAFRDRLLATIGAARPVLASPGILVVGSEVPNLLEPGAAATLVVSQDLDIGVPVDRHPELKARLSQLEDFAPSDDEPSVWLPRSPDLLELNFVGMDARQDPAEAYVLEDERLPLLVFGALSLVSPGPVIEIDGVRVPLPRPSGLILEKLVTDRTGEKGERDLLVALGLIAISGPADLDELVDSDRRLRPELRHAVRSNLTILSLIQPRQGMPDPRPRRADLAALLRRLDEPDRP